MIEVEDLTKAILGQVKGFRVSGLITKGTIFINDKLIFCGASINQVTAANVGNL